MLIECLTMREGPTQVSIGKHIYMFMPLTQFDRKRNPVRGIPTTSICDVTAEEHLKYMLSKPKQFREYESRDNAYVPEFNPMSGYSIERYKDAYLVVDKEEHLFAGSDGKWNKDRDKVAPFLSEADAFEWLKGETEDREPDLVDDAGEAKGA